MAQPSNDQRRQRRVQQRKRVKQGRKHAKALRQWQQQDVMLDPLAPLPPLQDGQT